MNGCEVKTEAENVLLAEHISGNRGYLLAKRVQDVLFSVLALVALFPLMLLIALAIVLDDPQAGPFFSQIRCGEDGKPFRFYKFRTMHPNAESKREDLTLQNEMHGPVFKIKKDPRITKVGSFLRRTSLDELPQLVNVLRGEMSLVGPRPPLPNEVAQYTAYQRQRLMATPGLTCYWQVHPERYNLSFDAWVELDIRYIRERNFWLDWKLILLTVRAMFRLSGQ